MIWDIIAGFFSGAVGAMGLGGGAVLLIYLALFKDTNQLKAQGINLMFFIPVAVISVIIYAVKKQIKWKIVLPLAVSGLIGAGIGVYISGIIGSKIIAKIFGALLCVLGVWQIISAFKKQQNSG
ncbi:MAG: sulfite exporter TauE/SafE family protein [Clostridia bacterium]|nr:sulfite exporter TauE/SafE family protein [Clostridia bacterium]